MLSALDALATLQAQMPGWLDKAESLRVAAHVKYNEFTKLSQDTNKAPSLRRRNGSTESLRPQDDGEKVPSVGDTQMLEPALAQSASVQALQSTLPTTPPPCSRINIDPRNRHLFREVREQRRKRKNPSLKDGQSGPQKSRTRLPLVIYYDSSIQEGFEILVKNISGARNVLRKARTAVSLRPKWTTMKPEESPFGRQGAYAYRIPTIPRLGSPQGNILAESKTGLEVYDQLDKDFEAAQTLCEVGAHQALRDGDCFEELADVKAHFARCVTLIDEEVANLKKQDEEIRIMRESGAEVGHALEVEGGTEPELSVFNSRDPSAVAVDGPIEADTEDTASIVVDLSEIPGRRQYSSKHQNKIRTPSSSAAPSSQDSSDLRAASPTTPDAMPAVEIEDKNLKYTRLGANVPLEHATAMAAASIAVGESTAQDEPDLNLSAMRTSIPRRRQEQPAPVAASAAPVSVEAVSEEPAFDFAAMRKAAIKRRGPPGPPALTKEVNEKVETSSEAPPKQPNLAIDSSFTKSHDVENEKSSLAVDPACGLRDMRRAQVA